MPTKEANMTKSKRLVGPWAKVDHDDHRWVRRIIGDSAGDHAAVVSLGAGDTWWRVYRADEASRGHAEGDVDDIEAGKVAADAHLDAAGWAIAAEPDERVASNRAFWDTLGLNGGKWIGDATDREQFLLQEHERQGEIVAQVVAALDHIDAPVGRFGESTQAQRVAWLAKQKTIAEQGFEYVFRAAAEIVAEAGQEPDIHPAPCIRQLRAIVADLRASARGPVEVARNGRPKVSGWHLACEDGPQTVFGPHGEPVAGAHMHHTGTGPGFAWWANVAFGPMRRGDGLPTMQAAQAAALAVLRMWADVEGEGDERIAEHSAVPGETWQPCTAALGNPSPCAMSHDVGPWGNDGADYEHPDGGVEAARRSGGLDAFSSVLGIVDRVVLPVGMTASCATGAQWMRVAITEAIQRLSGGLPMSVDEAAEDPPVRCGTFGAHLAPKAIEPAGPLSLVLAVSKNRDLIVLRRGGPWGAIDELPFPAGAGLWAWSGSAVDGAGGWSLEGEWTALPLPVLPAVEAPKAQAPRRPGDLSLLAARDVFGSSFLISRAGSWGVIESDDCPNPPSAGVWRWNGTAEPAGEDGEEHHFDGVWTLLPIDSDPGTSNDP
jgi:hypothetical protein